MPCRSPGRSRRSRAGRHRMRARCRRRAGRTRPCRYRGAARRCRGRRRGGRGQGLRRCGRCPRRPSRWSPQRLPKIVSSPAPPKIWSRPREPGTWSPQITSLPPSPRRVSPPQPPSSVSFSGPPCSTSAARDPIACEPRSGRPVADGSSGPDRLATEEAGRARVAAVDQDRVVAGSAGDQALGQRLVGLHRVDVSLPGPALITVAAAAADSCRPRARRGLSSPLLPRAVVAAAAADACRPRGRRRSCRRRAALDAVAAESAVERVVAGPARMRSSPESP